MIFDFADYKEFVRNRLQELPQGGRGQFQKMAKAAGMFPSNLSQVFNGEKQLTPEQGEAIAAHLQLTEAESDYFLLLIAQARAGSASLRARLGRQIQTLQKDNLQLAKRLPIDRAMDLAEKAVFYSNWYYSAIHLLTFIPELRSVDALAARLHLPRSLVQTVVNFLLDQGLCVAGPSGIEPGTKHTHLEASSPLIARHHANWRVKAIERQPLLHPLQELAYSGQLALSRADALKVRELCMRLVADARALVDPSPSEAAFCLNVDWFELN